jgi:1,4-alpha-glucan branching enzyme
VDFDGSGFSWIDCHDADHSVVSLLRRARDGTDFTVAVANFTPVPRPGYWSGCPRRARIAKCSTATRHLRR